jgi:hypothetical protein
VKKGSRIISVGHGGAVYLLQYSSEDVRSSREKFGDGRLKPVTTNKKHPTVCVLPV